MRHITVMRTRLAMVAMAAVLGSGCGDDNDKATSGHDPKAAFLARANAVCRAGNKVTDAGGQKLGRTPSAKEVADYVRAAFVPTVQGEINGVRALNPPPGDEAAIKKMLDLAQADLDRVKASPQLLVAGDDAFGEFAKIAHPYGLTDCDKAQ